MQMHFGVMLYKWPVQIMPEIRGNGLIESRRRGGQESGEAEGGESAAGFLKLGEGNVDGNGMFSKTWVGGGRISLKRKEGLWEKGREREKKKAGK